MTFDWTQFFSRRSGNKQAPPPPTTTTTATTISSTTTTIPPPSDELWDLVLDMDWSGVIEHAAEQPHNAQWQDGHWDETPLYLACQFHPPPDAIEAIIRAYPKAVTIPSRENHDLPIHLSCRYQAPIEVLEALIQDSPHTAVEQTRWGKTPLTVLWEFRPSSTSNNVTTTSTTTSLDDDVEFRSKVDLLLNAVARYRYDEQRRHQQHQQQLSSLECCDDTESKNDVGVDSIQSNNNYNNNSTTTTTTTIHTTTEEEEYSFVHAAVSLGARCCPMEILEYVLRKYPTQISTRDRFDELPLHIILGPTSFSKATKRKYKPREQSFISRLLQIYPEAAKETAPIRIARSDSSSIDDDDGGNDDDDNNNIGQQTQVFRRYPLHIALSNRHCWFGGIQDLFLAGPYILLVQDPITKLYPFQLAAVPVGETTVDLDTIYHLLRSEPTVLSFCDDDSNNRKREREKNIIDDGNNKIIFSTKKEKEETITSKKPQAELSSPLTIQEVVVGIVTAMLLGYWATGSSHVTSE